MTIAARRRDEQGRADRPRPGRGGRHEAAQATAEMPDILQALCEEHRYQLRVFKLLEKQVAMLNLRKEPDYGVMHGVMRYMTNYPDRFHHPKEDLVFRKLVQRDPASDADVNRLLDEHVQILEKGAELLALIDRCRVDPKRADTFVLRKSAHKYIGHLRRHMDVEELRVFPRAQRVLHSEDWAEIDSSMGPILDPVFGETVADEFRTLRAEDYFLMTGARRFAAPSSWVEAAAAIESVSALLAGATTAGADLSRHNRAALGRNAAFLRELLGAGQCDRRVGVVRKACKQNVRMARGVIRQLSDVWTEAFKAARRPYQAKRAHAAK
ncbi:MAG: hemerythrin domain-containing protein [Proteobacteria bacterium]|nr:hemerythrin domain-containing protein [Pseudomonadota bacterium]